MLRGDYHAAHAVAVQLVVDILRRQQHHMTVIPINATCYTTRQDCTCTDRVSFSLGMCVDASALIALRSDGEISSPKKAAGLRVNT